MELTIRAATVSIPGSLRPACFFVAVLEWVNIYDSINYRTFPKPKNITFSICYKKTSIIKSILSFNMKTIKIEKYTDKRTDSYFTKDKCFWVFLGNGSKHSFTNKKHLKKFLAETNEFLKARLFELNKIYAEIFTEYRKIWFYFDGESLKTFSDRFDDDLILVNKSFRMIIERSSWNDGNQLTFKHFYYVIEMFTGILNVMIEVQKAKSNYVEKRNLEVIASRLAYVKMCLENFGK